MTGLLLQGPVALDGVRPAVVATVRTRDRTALAVLGAATLVGVLALVLAYRFGLTLQFGDEAPHLLAARRVTDSLTPGFGQLGQYWLPLFTVLELPFAWIDPLYRSGLAGAIPAVVAYAVGTAGAFVLGRELGRSRAAGLVAALAYGTTPALLYLAVRPMMDTTVAATLVWAPALLAKHLRTGRLRDLLLASGATALGCLAHYPLWVVPVLGVPCLVAAGVRAGHPWARIRLTLSLYLLAPVVAVVSWLAWGFYLQHDAFYFLHKAVAGSPVTVPPLTRGQAGNVAFVLLDVGLAALTTLGPVLAAAAVVVVVGGLLRGRVLTPLALASPGWLYLLASFTLLGGAISSPLLASLVSGTRPSDGIDNNLRYLLYALPFATGALAVLVGPSTRRAVVAGVLVLAAVPAAGVLGWGLPTPSFTQASALARLTVAEGLRERVAVREAGRLVPGSVLLSSSADGDEVAFRSGLPLRTFLTEANGRRYQQGLRHLQEVRFIVITSDGTMGGHVDVRHLLRLGFLPVPLRPLYGRVLADRSVEFSGAASVPTDPGTAGRAVTAGVPSPRWVSGRLAAPPGTTYDVNGYELWERP